ncbi:hypothetical protein ACTFIZ_008180 [Dictyostelium cf. discoideum]
MSTTKILKTKNQILSVKKLNFDVKSIKYLVYCLYGYKNVNGFDQYIGLDTYFTRYLKSVYSDKYAYPPTSTIDIYPQKHAIGNILVHPWNKNVWIKGIGSCSIVFSGSSTVDIQNSVILDFGHTTSSPLNSNNIIPKNIQNRYPITLYHNKKFVKIENNCFLPALFTREPQKSSTPRSFIGAIRSFGNIIGNSFILSESNINGNINSTEQVLSIGWATDNIKYSIPLSGIEIYSNIQTPFSIPF